MRDQILIYGIPTIAIAGGLGFLWYKGKKKQVLELIAFLVDTAEKTYGSGTGEYKYAFVIGKLYPQLPSIVRAVISPTVIDKFIVQEVDKLQEKLKTKVETL